MTYWKEGRLEEQIAVLDRAMAMADPPDPADDSWTHLLMEALVYKGIAEYRTGADPAVAYATFGRVIEISPWPNAHNVQYANSWREFLRTNHADRIAAGEAGQ